jgi:hypothetical protein
MYLTTYIHTCIHLCMHSVHGTLERKVLAHDDDGEEEEEEEEEVVGRSLFDALLCFGISSAGVLCWCCSAVLGLWVFLLFRAGSKLPSVSHSVSQ